MQLCTRLSLSRNFCFTESFCTAHSSLTWTKKSSFKCVFYHTYFLILSDLSSQSLAPLASSFLSSPSPFHCFSLSSLFTFSYFSPSVSCVFKRFIFVFEVILLLWGGGVSVFAWNSRSIVDFKVDTKGFGLDKDVVNLRLTWEWKVSRRDLHSVLL